MFVRSLAVLFGIGFIFAGVAGFLPQFTTDGMLFGLFATDTMHNLVHIISGVIAIMAATSFKYARLYFEVFGIIYLLVALAGFWLNGELLMMQMNFADNLLHLAIGVVAVYVGFSAKNKLA
ncbi:MAG: DUF4383 domain-containing protein [Gammaproteobacteria bacterium]|nr:MAG: DUF4383 domain-containing protein [Gammaproteobacteria bacterium]